MMMKGESVARPSAPFKKRGNQSLGKGCCPETKMRPDTVETTSTPAEVTRDDQMRVTPHLQGLIKAHLAARALAKRKGLRPSFKKA